LRERVEKAEVNASTLDKKGDEKEGSEVRNAGCNNVTNERFL
jgi:hypothetical protein